ncbi:nuclear pore complex protein NUP1 isoform X4 [Sorghum bicolor]|uniref:nuclear pore complex protein NUP1 isoform X4 n=1 Tax=Sorghum bicolor TaxID=4558 RepID=UPI000B426D29|nr:nuclear pore complex protein NUP1 isoform X4 [Sorghum bicolor]|eukprot:XP_021301802.1 nuclear pore complex protein NUP1 isoform X4 [Sorghum bicolor]
MESPRYDYGTGGKIRRHPPSRAVAASPYARPATAPTNAPGTATAAVSQGGGWLSRIIAAGTSRFLPSLFRTSPPQLTAPAPPPHELLETLSRDQLLVDAPPSPLPPPLEDDLPECEENSGVAANNLFTENPQSSAKGEEENMLRNCNDHGGMALEELLKPRTFTRSEFEYLASLLWSKTIGVNSLKPEDGNIGKMIVCDKENGSEHSNLPLDFSTTTYSIDDQVASPAEIAKAYMGSKSSKGSPLRLRLHNPSSMPITSIKASMPQKAKPPTIPLAQGSRLHTSKTSDRLESNYTTPNGAIYKMSSSPYFKSGVSSKELFGSVSSHYQTSSSVHTFGRQQSFIVNRQVLKRKSTAVSNESVCDGPIRRMHEKYNRTSPLLETKLGYRRYPVGYGSKLEGPEQLAPTQKRRCLDKVGVASHSSIEDRAHVNCFGQAPEQSAEMAAKILKQLDILVPSQKENTLEIKHKLESAICFEEDVSRQKKVPAERDLLEPSPSEVEYSLPDGITSNKSMSQITLNKENPPASSFRGNAPNLVLSDEIGQNKMTPANDFTFPIPTVNNAHSQGPPTPTLASPPILTVEKQPSLSFTASVTSAESGPRISKSVLGAVTQKLDSKLNADDQQMPSKNSGQGASFTSNPVFKVDGPGYASNCIVSAIQPSNTSIGSASFQSAGSSTICTNLASKSTQSCSTGGSLTFSNTGFGSLSAGSPSVAFGFPPVWTASSPAVQRKSEAANSSTTFSSMEEFGIVGSSTMQDKTKAVDSSTPVGFSQKFHTVSSALEDMSKAASAEPTSFSGNHNAQSKNCSSLFTQSPANTLCFKSSENLNSGSSHCFADSPVGSATMGLPLNSSSLFAWAAASGPTSVTTPPSSPATSSSFAFSSSPAFLAQSVFSSKFTAPAAPSYGSPNTGPATSPFSPMPSAVFSFTSATPSIPNPPTPIFGHPTVQMNGGNMVVDGNGSPSPATSPFGLRSSASQLTPTFSMPATQFASGTSGSAGVFEVGQYSQVSSGGFSMGSSGGNDKSGRKTIRVKRRK